LPGNQVIAAHRRGALLPIHCLRKKLPFGKRYGYIGEERAEMMKKGENNSSVPYKFIQEVNKMTQNDFVKRFIQEENGILALRKLIGCKKTQAFAICPLVVIVSGDDPENAAGAHPGWFLPPFPKGGISCNN
jgi:hypothetical protein